MNIPLNNLWELEALISQREANTRGYDWLNAQEGARALALAVQYATGSPVHGDIAEFGTATGRTARVLAAAMTTFGSKSSLHLFDSFAGLPVPDDPVDSACSLVKSKHWDAGTCKALSAQELMKVCQQHLRPDRVIIYPGWYQYTLVNIHSHVSFSVVHIDCDLYASAHEVLDRLFSHGHIACGAMILFDDWNCNGADPTCGERRAWSEAVEKFKVQASDCGPYSWCAHRFIVHSYQE